LELPVIVDHYATVNLNLEDVLIAHQESGVNGERSWINSLINFHYMVCPGPVRKSLCLIYSEFLILEGLTMIHL
jgi:hypothetical protein